MNSNLHTLKNIEQAREFEAIQRRAIAEVSAAGNYSELANIVNDLAAAQGAINVFRMVELLEENNATTLERIQELTEMTSRGADDSGSGRNNDARRAFHDGVRAVAAKQLAKLFRTADKEFYPEEVEY